MLRFKIFPSQPATFHSPYSVEETKKKLLEVFSTDSISGHFRTLLKSSFFIKSWGNQIRIYYQQPLWHDPTIPVYYATLIPDGTGTKIEGVFHALNIFCVFMTIWLGMDCSIFISSLLTRTRFPEDAIGCILMGVIGLAFIRFGWWRRSKKDIPLISETIEKALGASPADTPEMTPGRGA